MNTETVVRNIDESMRDCLRYAKKARGHPGEFKEFIKRARRWQALLTDYMTDQEARARYQQAYNDIFAR